MKTTLISTTAKSSVTWENQMMLKMQSRFIGFVENPSHLSGFTFWNRWFWTSSWWWTVSTCHDDWFFFRPWFFMAVSHLEHVARTGSARASQTLEVLAPGSHDGMLSLVMVPSWLSDDKWLHDWWWWWFIQAGWWWFLADDDSSTDHHGGWFTKSGNVE